MAAGTTTAGTYEGTDTCIKQTCFPYTMAKLETQAKMSWQGLSQVLASAGVTPYSMVSKTTRQTGGTGILWATAL